MWAEPSRAQFSDEKFYEISHFQKISDRNCIKRANLPIGNDLKLSESDSEDQRWVQTPENRIFSSILMKTAPNRIFSRIFCKSDQKLSGILFQR